MLRPEYSICALSNVLFTYTQYIYKKVTTTTNPKIGHKNSYKYYITIKRNINMLLKNRKPSRVNKIY